MPGRSTFVALPKDERKFYRASAISLRNWLKCMLPFHIAFLVISLIIYWFEAIPILFECVFIFLCCHNIKRLNKLLCFI